MFRRLKSRKDAVPRKVAAFGSAGEIFSLDTLFHRRRYTVANDYKHLRPTQDLPCPRFPIPIPRRKGVLTSYKLWGP